MDDELTAPQMQKLLGLSRQALSALVRDGIIVRAERRGRYKLESVPRYCEHLREIGAGRGSDVGADACARLGTAQAALAEAKAAQLRGELVEASAVEAF